MTQPCVSPKVLQKGTSIIEYSLLIAIVVAALIGMQIYLKRAVCGNWKQAGDIFGFGRQYKSRDPVSVKNTQVSNNPINTTITSLPLTTE